MSDLPGEWEEVNTKASSSSSSPRPGATQCSSCHVVTEYAHMTRMGRRWFCEECQDRLTRLHLF